jgi:hypothetical protein
MSDMRDQQPVWFITGPVEHQNALIDAKEDILDKIRSFMSGPQRAIYDEVRAFLASQDANLSYIDPQAGQKIRDALADPDCYKGSSIQELKTGFYQIKETIELAVLAERKAVVKAIDEVADKVSATREFQALAPELQAQIRRSIEAHKERLETQTMIAVLRDRANGVRNNLLSQIMGEVVALAAPPAEPGPSGTPGGMAEPGGSPPPRPQEFTNARDLLIPFSKTYLENESDVDQYLDEMKRALLTTIGSGKKVLI